MKNDVAYLTGYLVAELEKAGVGEMPDGRFLSELNGVRTPLLAAIARVHREVPQAEKIHDLLMAIAERAGDNVDAAFPVTVSGMGNETEGSFWLGYYAGRRGSEWKATLSIAPPKKTERFEMRMTPEIKQRIIEQGGAEYVERLILADMASAERNDTANP